MVILYLEVVRMSSRWSSRKECQSSFKYLVLPLAFVSLLGVAECAQAVLSEARLEDYPIEQHLYRFSHTRDDPGCYDPFRPEIIYSYREDYISGYYYE